MQNLIARRKPDHNNRRHRRTMTGVYICGTEVAFLDTHRCEWPSRRLQASAILVYREKIMSMYLIAVVIPCLSLRLHNLMTTTGGVKTFLLQSSHPDNLYASIFQLPSPLTLYEVIGLSHPNDTSFDLGFDECVCTGRKSRGPDRTRLQCGVDIDMS
jgi:hypothetical protein